MAMRLKLMILNEYTTIHSHGIGVHLQYRCIDARWCGFQRTTHPTTRIGTRSADFAGSDKSLSEPSQPQLKPRSHAARSTAGPTSISCPRAQITKALSLYKEGRARALLLHKEGRASAEL